MKRRAVRELAGLGIAAAALLGPQPARPMVDLDIVVLDRAGRPVEDLSAGDFTLLTSGRPLPVESIAVGAVPLHLVLLVDLTVSIRVHEWQRVLREDVERSVIGGLREGELLAIGGFGRELRLSEEPTANRKRLREALGAALSHDRDDLVGPSPVWDFTYRAVESFPPVPGRRAVILVTDGRATANARGAEEVAEVAIRRGVSLSIVGQDFEYQVPQDERTAVLVRSGNALRWLAQVTGGQYISAVESALPPAAALAEVMSTLRQTYTLRFEAPAADDRLRPIEVQVRRPNLRVHVPAMFAATRS